ncbi:hypothetical protein B0H16DRAFT_1731119 [Mycena metata]|uniref:Uncharacterized protein n=1 Tax=Mycena metata TaxID=1033252 RepID=A0AAD7I6Z6_9AGAR|nr:hypothetical protein B0H16DRAFT_1731119 [Mycena metata]
MPKDTQTSQALTAEQKKLLDGLAAAEKYLDNHADKSSPSSREFTQRAKAHVSVMYDRTKAKSQKSTPHNKSLKKAETRLGSILHQASLPPFTPEAWLDNLEASHAGSTHAEREDAAIIRAFRGCDGSDGQSPWREIVAAKLLMNSTDLKNRINTNRAHSILPIEERFTAWQNSITSDTRSSMAHKFSNHVLNQIICAKFAYEWEELDGPGSKTAKGEFYEKAYQDLPETRQFFASLDKAQKTFEMANNHEEEYTKWRRATEVHVTARKRWIDFYESFGPVLLMDPYWSVDALIPGHCSREFPILIKLLLDSMPCDPDDENTTLVKGRYRDSWKALMGVLTAFDTDFALFVNEFLRQRRTTAYVAATKA